MKPLYHCAKCGRLSTRLSSFTCFEAQLYCKVCVPDDVSTALTTLTREA